MKRKILVLLALVLIFALVAVSCADPQTEPAGKTDEKITGGEIGGLPEETTEISDGLPETDFAGYDFRIHSFESISSRIFVEEDIGEVINDAKYGVRKAVEERFNVKISLILGPSDGSNLSGIKKSIMAGDDAFDLIHAHDLTLCTTSLENIFVNLYSVPNLDFTKPWWPKNSADSLTVLGQMYVFSNAMTTDSIGNIRALFMNKEIARDRGLTVPYQDVFDGAWTIDKLIGMTKDIYSDINGNGEADEEDVYGFEYRDQYFICTLEPLEIVPLKRDENEGIVLNLNNERTLTAIDKLYSLLFGAQSTYFKPDNSADNQFTKGRAFATCIQINSAVETLRFSDVNYGILPMPKLDDSQKNYYAGYTSYLCAVPNNARDLNRTGIIIEALSAEGHKKILPAYYEIALKNKYLQDEESIRILDLINEAKMLDFAWCYNTASYWFMRDMFFVGKPPNTDFTSWYDKNEAKIQKDIGNIIQKFEIMREN
jgi:hypothetical protein